MFVLNVRLAATTRVTDAEVSLDWDNNLFESITPDNSHSLKLQPLANSASGQLSLHVKPGASGNGKITLEKSRVMLDAGSVDAAPPAPITIQVSP